MKTPIYGIDDFRRMFKNTQYENNFSDAGLKLLYDYLIEYENDKNEDITVSAKILCEDFIEIDSDELVMNYNESDVVKCDIDNNIYILRQF